jgi:ribA/ribD-fused uncharacterized protein
MTLFWRGSHYLSNHHISFFIKDYTVYNCVEQYMMAKKATFFEDWDALVEIMKEDDPKKQKKLGRQVKGFIDWKWEAIARDVVYDGCWAKFSQSSDLGKKLLFETDMIIAEASPYDTIWGIGCDEHQIEATCPKLWRGKNWLGQVLMKIKEDIFIGSKDKDINWIKFEQHYLNVEGT